MSVPSPWLLDSLPPPHFDNFSWPSLYSPAKEIGFVGSPVQPGGYYLSNPDDVFKFTLYWTLIFHLPFNLLAGTYAFFNFLFPPVRNAGDTIVFASPPAHSQPTHHHARSRSTSAYSQPHSASSFSPVDDWLKPPRANARRSRLTFALLVLLSFLSLSVLSAVVGAAVLAFVLVGVYRAGGFYMTTWIPFVWAVIQSLIALLEIWPSIIDIV